MDSRPHDLPDPRDGNPRASSRPPHAPDRPGADPDRSSPSVGVGPSPHPPVPDHEGDESPFPGWLYEDDEPAPRPIRDGSGRRRWMLVAAGVVPWLFVSLLALRSTGGATDPGPAPSPVETASSGPAIPESRDAAVPGGRAPLDAGEGSVTVLGNPGARVTLADATSLATVLARDWIGGGPSLGMFEAPALPDAYVDHLEVEAVDHPAPGHAVVTLLAVVLRAGDGTYDRAELRRVAVPVAVDAGGARSAGEPWWLPSPALTSAAPDTTPIDDPVLTEEVRGVLARAGYGEVTAVALGEMAGWPLVARFVGVAPGDTASAEHTVWIREHLGGLVVAGSRPTDEEATP